MPFTTSNKTLKNIAKIKAMLLKEPLWANEIARRLSDKDNKVRPEMINYYMKNYLHDDVEQFDKKGSNILLRLKKK